MPKQAHEPKTIAVLDCTMSAYYQILMTMTNLYSIEDVAKSSKQNLIVILKPKDKEIRPEIQLFLDAFTPIVDLVASFFISSEKISQYVFGPDETLVSEMARIFGGKVSWLDRFHTKCSIRFPDGSARRYPRERQRWLPKYRKQMRARFPRTSANLIAAIQRRGRETEAKRINKEQGRERVFVLQPD